MKRPLTFFMIAAMVVFLASCSSTRREGAPVTFGKVGQGAGVVIVQSGDALYKIADRYKVAMRDLIAVNKLKPPYNLFVGQRLVLPSPEQYRVQSGDTLYSISRSFGVDMTELARANRLSSPYAVKVGQNLRLPGGAAVQKLAKAQPSLIEKLPPLPGRKPVLENRAMASAEDKTILKPKPVIFETPPAQEEPVTLALLPPPEPEPKIAETEQSPAPEPSPPVKTDFKADISHKLPPGRAGRFIWPVNGRVVSAYGSKDGGLHNDGINIAAPHGSPVRAAENGIVAYAGDELKGFGNLLLVRHSDGWMTAYAHLDKALVERGQSVVQGQVIGTLGKTGSVDSPQLHFEIRRGSRALDPADYLDRQNMTTGSVNPDEPAVARPNHG